MNKHPEFDFHSKPKMAADEAPVSLLEKIKKLLRLAGSSNAHEAALAMAKAMEMADRHNLDLSTINDDPDLEPIIHKWFPTAERVSQEYRSAIGVVSTYFNVTPCYGYKRILFVGREEDVLIAEYIANNLVASCRRCLREDEAAEKRARRRMTPRKRRGFKAGFFYGIHHQLSQKRDAILLENAKFAIVLADQEKAREAAMHDVVGETETIKPRDQKKNNGAVMRGWNAGLNTRIDKPLNGAGNPALALTGP